MFLTLEFASLSGRGAGLAVAGEKRAGWSSDPAGRIRANRIGQAFRHRLIGTCSVLFIARPSPWALGRKREFRGPKPASRIDEDPFPGGLVIAMLLHGRRVSTCMISLEPSAALHSACASKRPKLSTKTTTPTGSLLARWLVCTHTHRQVAGRRSPARQHGIRAARYKTLNSQGRASDAELGRIRWVQNRRSPPAQEGRSGVMPLRSSKDPGSCSLGTAPARTMARIRGRFCFVARSRPTYRGQSLASKAGRQSGRAAGRQAGSGQSIGSATKAKLIQRAPTSAGGAPGPLRFRFQKKEKSSEDDDMSVESQAERGTRLAVRLQAEISLPCTAEGEKERDEKETVSKR